jgi:S1-C subfamily serine protease
VERDRDEWRRPWTAPDDQPAVAAYGAVLGDTPQAPAVGAPTIERPRPLPPPGGWQGGQPPAEPTPRRSGGGFVRTLLIALLGAVVGTAGTLAVVDTTPAQTATPTPNGPAVQAPSVDVDDLDSLTVVPAVARAVLPSVVRIDVSDGSAASERRVALGSGVIYRSDGYIITNNHVIEPGNDITVKLADGAEHRAEVVGTDPRNDLAVLKIDVTGLPAVNLREDPPVVGEMAIAIGSPFGLDASVTVGVVSATGRDIRVPGDGGQATLIAAVIQTDAAINPGNSGGALVDAQGRLLGINTAILTQTGGSQGVGFAISVTQAVTSANQLIETGEVQYPLLGVLGTDVTPEMAERLGLEEQTGAVLQEVVPGSGAADAGLQEEDVIVAVNDHDITNMTDLVVTIRRFRPGDTVDITYIRNGDRQTVPVTLGEAPDS